MASQSYNRVRSKLLNKGYTLASWARTKNRRPSTVYDAIKGERNGVVSVQVRRELEEFLYGC